MSTDNVRFKFNCFHIDKTWKDNFTDNALKFLSNNREWLYEKLNFAVNGLSKDGKQEDNEGLDWIVILDCGDAITNEKTKEAIKTLTNVDIEKDNKQEVRTVLVASDSSLYENYYNMFIKNGDNFKRGAVMNLQAENDALKEIAKVIVDGANAKYDRSILFPYSKQCWKDNDTKEDESYFK